MFNYEPEIKTDIEQLYSERITAFNVALNERITQTKLDLEFEKRQNKILMDKIEFLELEINNEHRRITASYRNNSKLKEENQRLRKKYLGLE